MVLVLSVDLGGAEFASISGIDDELCNHARSLRESDNSCRQLARQGWSSEFRAQRLARSRNKEMSDITPQTNTPYPEPPAKKRNDLAIELIAGSVGGATQVLIGQVSPLRSLRGIQLIIIASRYIENG